MINHWVRSVAASSVLLLAISGIAFAGSLPPGGSFLDDDGNVHEGNIEAIAAADVTRGCNPPANDLYCPGDSVTRGQIAAFLHRALPDLPANDEADFSDIEESVFEADIRWLASAGVTRGCDPPTNSLFCPDDAVTRGQMAAFLNRALGLSAGDANFTDTAGHTFEADVAALASADITRGCNPPDNTLFCPDDPVTRDQMASFLARALDLQPMVPPPRPTTSTTSTSTTSTTTQPANPGDTKNCDDFSTQEEAQAWFDTYYPYYGDVARLDADGNGIACESLP